MTLSASAFKSALPCFVPCFSFWFLPRARTSCACGVVQPHTSPATRGNWSSRLRSVPSGFTPVSLIPGVSFQSRLADGGQPANAASCINDLFFGPCPERSVAVGVVHPARLAWSSNDWPGFAPRARLSASLSGLPRVASQTPGVAHPATSSKSGPPEPRFRRLEFGPPLGVFGVGHPVESLATVGRADARSAQIGGVVAIPQCFQVSEYSIEPVASKRARSLFAKHDCRAALTDETAELRPKVTRVFRGESFARDTERLAGTTASPTWLVVGPTGETKGIGPSADTGEKVALDVSSKFNWFNISYRPFIDHTIGDRTRLDQFAQPRCGLGIIFVVVVHYALKSGGIRPAGETFARFDASCQKS